MNEEDISKIVSSVLHEIKIPTQQTSNHIKEHHCSCKPKKMTLELAVALIERVKQEAIARTMKVVIAIVDSSARPVAIQAMDDAYIASYDIALNKAFTSVGLKMSTETLGKLSQPGESLYGIQYTNEGKIVIFGGGEPLEIDGTIIGGIGVSGGSAEDDTSLAIYGRNLCKEVYECL